MGDPLIGLKARIDWEALRSGLNRVADSKTAWLFRKRLKHLDRVQALFDRFHPQLAEQGYAARAGQMTGAAFVEVLRLRNSREDNADQAHKWVQRYRVTDVAVHDSPVFGVFCD